MRGRCARQEPHSTLHKIAEEKPRAASSSGGSSVAEVRRVSSQRPLHRKQADEKRLRRASVMQLSVDIKAPLHLKNATASLC